MTATVLVSPLALAFRAAGLEVHPFVRDSWLKSQWAADMKTKMRRGDFSRLQGARIDRLLGKALVTIAYAPAEPNEVLGYVVTEVGLGPVVHWVYVKHAYRRLGIARALLVLAKDSAPPGPMQHTHKGDARGKKLAARFAAQFNPYLLEA